MFALRHDTGSGSPCTTATLTGTLARTDLPRLRRTLDTLLAPARPVILDVSRVAMQFPPAVEELSRSLLAAGGWPAAQLIVTGPDERFRAALRSTGTIRDVVVADDLQEARSRLCNRPERVRRRLTLRPGTSAPGRARAFVARTCADWDLPLLVDDARRITAELVRPARTPAVLTVALDREGLRIALRYFDPHRQPQVPAAVRRRASSCGLTPRSDGATVWAVLPATRTSRCYRGGAPATPAP